MTVPKEVISLVERFDPASKLNETQVRREFIDPFFKALGWDVGVLLLYNKVLILLV